MADKVLVATAKDVTATLKAGAVAGTFSIKFVPKRSYLDWDAKLEDSDTLHGDVVSAGFDETGLSDRGGVMKLAVVHVGIRKRFGSDAQDPATGRIELAELDKLENLVEEIADFFMKEENQRLPSVPDAVWHDTKVLVAYMPKHIWENRQFTGIVQIRFEVDEDL